MFLSNNNNLIFFHVPKTAGTSIHNFLRGSYQQNWPILSVRSFKLDNYGIPGPETDPPPFIHHIPAKKYMKFFPEHREYFKFAFVRNPFERLLSAYSDMTQQRQIINGGGGDASYNFRKLLLSQNLWDSNCLTIQRTQPNEHNNYSSYDEYFNHHMQAYGWLLNTNNISFYKQLSENAAAKKGADIRKAR